MRTLFGNRTYDQNSSNSLWPCRARCASGGKLTIYLTSAAGAGLGRLAACCSEGPDAYYIPPVESREEFQLREYGGAGRTYEAAARAFDQKYVDDGPPPGDGVAAVRRPARRSMSSIWEGDEEGDAEVGRSV
jgi:hypothetical protein